MSAPTLERPTGRSVSASSPPANAIRQHQDLIQVAGILDRQDQHGFLRTTGYLPGPEDVFVLPEVIRRHGLRSGDVIEGAATQKESPPSKPSKPSNASNASKARPLIRVDTVNGRLSHESAARAHFAAMTPIHPRDRLRLAADAGRVSTRIVDLIAPIGKGQRGLIVAPPKTGKTMLLQAIAAGVTANHPECHLMVVLLDERPEEVTDMRRTVDGEIIASTFDRPVHEHIAIAELAIERAKRLAEQGQDVVVLLDSITRLCRAHNNNAKSSGRTLSGGVDASAVAAPKKLFGAARNLEEGGSITILATALVDTGSRADDYFFEELKSTGNMELRLDRTLADKRIFPAIDIATSGTRREELLMPATELDAIGKLRRVLSTRTNQQAIELLLEGAKQNAGNNEFLWRVTHPGSSGS